MEIRYTCMGPRLTAEAARAALEGRISALAPRIASLSPEASVAIKLKVAGLNDELENIKARDPASFTERAGCGYDLSEQIKAVPDDGDVYEYTCPACGNTGTMKRTPPAEAQATDAQ